MADYDETAVFRESMGLNRSAREALNWPFGWQPIETAPKDGTEVLLFDGYDPDDPCIYVGLWSHGEWIPSIGLEKPMTHTVFTHWMPLPAPPTT